MPQSQTIERLRFTIAAADASERVCLRNGTAVAIRIVIYARYEGQPVGEGGDTPARSEPTTAADANADAAADANAAAGAVAFVQLKSLGGRPESGGGDATRAAVFAEEGGRSCHCPVTVLSLSCHWRLAAPT